MPDLLPAPKRRAVLAAAIGASFGARAGFQVREWPATQPPPPFSLNDLEQKPWRVAELRGRAVILNFWATWCEPCRAEMPALETLAARHRADALVVLTVNFRESEATIRRFLEQQPITLPILLDPTGHTTRAWTPGVFPSTVLIDRQGRPRRIVVGEFDWSGGEARTWTNELIRSAG
ncbi:MAG: TlpA family protein disulfide reductase [Burkholderiaceae bacterium]|nr:TlpA family protein disulfide reductase [Burkholderiaceae bacterium]